MDVKKVTDFKWLNLYTINNPGKPEWIYASRKRNITNENFRENVIKSDAVVIVPRKGNQIILIEQFREPIQNIEIGFPAGLYESSDSLESAVKRELKEETGLDLVKIERISPQLFSSSGLTDESLMVVWVECVGELSLEYQEKHEDIINIEAVDIDKIQNFINTAPFVNTVADNVPKVFGSKAYLILLQLIAESKGQ